MLNVYNNGTTNLEIHILKVKSFLENAILNNLMKIINEENQILRKHFHFFLICILCIDFPGFFKLLTRSDSPETTLEVED